MQSPDGLHTNYACNDSSCRKVLVVSVTPFHLLQIYFPDRCIPFTGTTKSTVLNPFEYSYVPLNAGDTV